MLCAYTKRFLLLRHSGVAQFHLSGAVRPDVPNHDADSTASVHRVSFRRLSHPGGAGPDDSGLPLLPSADHVQENP